MPSGRSAAAARPRANKTETNLTFVALSVARDMPVNAQDGRAMFELQLELHARATGVLPPISADDLLEVHALLEQHRGDIKSLFAR